jgi:hypothetical protein
MQRFVRNVVLPVTLGSALVGGGLLLHQPSPHVPNFFRSSVPMRPATLDAQSRGIVQLEQDAPNTYRSSVPARPMVPDLQNRGILQVEPATGNWARSSIRWMSAGRP